MVQVLAQQKSSCQILPQLSKSIGLLVLFNDRDLLLERRERLKGCWRFDRSSGLSFGFSLELVEFLYRFLNGEGMIVDAHRFATVPPPDLNQPGFEALLFFPVVSCFLLDPDEMLGHKQMANGVRGK